MLSRRRPGFTLIELLTVIAIIGILSAVLFPAITGIRKKAKQASAQTAFTQWAAGLTRYKQVYGFYPNIGTTYVTATDTFHDLEDAATNLKFIKSLSARTPLGATITPADRKILNRNAEEFCAFGKDDFEDPANLTDSSLLVDRFGNRRIRVIFDTDNNTRIRNITVPGGAFSIPEDVRAVNDTNGLPARIIIYTTDLGGDFASSEGSVDPSDFAQVLAIQ